MAENTRGLLEAGTMPSMTCPKCGFEQEAGAECARCGIIFARYRPEGRDSQRVSDPQRVPAVTPRSSGMLRIFLRVFRWVVPAIAVTALILALRTSPPPRIPLAPAVVGQSEAKVHEFQTSVQTGKTERLELTQSEVNAWLDAHLAIKHPEAGASPAAPLPVVDQPASGGETKIKAPEPAAADDKPSASLRDVKVELLSDSVRVYAAFDLHGKSLSLELEGRLITKDGYLRLEPTGGKLGSLPLPASVLETAMRQVFDAPQNREKFHLPANIDEMKVERGNLVVVPR